MTATAVRVPKAKHVHVNGHPIRLRFIQNIIWGTVVSLLLTAAVAAFYYLTAGGGLSQAMHMDWNNLFHYVWWTTYRHGIRNVGEGVAAKFGVDTLMAKWQKEPDERLSGWQLSWRVPALFTEALAVIIAGIYLVHYGFPYLWNHFPGLHLHAVAGATVNGPVGSIFSGVNWPDFIVGFVAAHALKGQWRPIGSTISLALIEPAVEKIRTHRVNLAMNAIQVAGRRYAASMPAEPAPVKAATWLPTWMKLPDLPPTVRERVAWLLDTRAILKKHSPWMYRLALAGLVAVIGLAGYGEYVLHVIAKGH